MSSLNLWVDAPARRSAAAVTGSSSSSREMAMDENVCRQTTNPLRLRVINSERFSEMGKDEVGDDLGRFDYQESSRRRTGVRKDKNICEWGKPMRK